MKEVFVGVLLLYVLTLHSQDLHVQYEAITMDFELEETAETAKENPFSDYRLQVLFSHDGREYNVPGFYAADGDAANTSADHGSTWRVIFSPPNAGKWDYKVSFQKGQNMAMEEDPYLGEAIAPHHGKKGSFNVRPASKEAPFFQRSGNLMYNGSRYLHTKNGQPKLLFGTNSPENFLAYEDIDGTYAADSEKDYTKSWEPHLKDWKEGDPTWKSGKGKGIIGALNYLSSKGMNVVYALTLNLHGDASDVWPFIGHHRKDFKRYDVSKLAQWDIVFAHAEKLGITMELILQEQENQLILDDGYTNDVRKLYLRELIARFGYHNNIIWNIGEENGPQQSYWPQGQNDQQRFAMIRYLKDHDPYQHPVLVHTYPGPHERDHIVKPLLKFDKFDGLSMQIGDMRDVHSTILRWILESEENSRPWIVLMDELGPYHTGSKADYEDPDHDEIRKNVLWGALMAGAAGVEWYFGWENPPNDLNAEDWRSRNNLWEQSKVAKDFFSQIEYTRMRSMDSLISLGDNYCFAVPDDTYVIYLKNGSSTKLNLEGQKGEFQVFWYNPRKGGPFLRTEIKRIQGGTWCNLGFPPKNRYKDWVVLVKKRVP